MERAFRVLQTVAAAGGPVGVREIGRRAELPRSTVSRLVGQLHELGMVQRTPSGDVVTGGAVTTLLPRTGPLEPSLEDRFRPLLLELVDRFGESAALTVDTPAGAHYLVQIPGPGAVQVPDSTGETFPFHVVAPGLALMAAWDDERLDAYLAGELDAPTRHSVIDPTTLRSRLAAVRSRGHVWTDQELDEEVNGLAVVVAEGVHTLAAVSLYGPAYRLNPTRRPELAAELGAVVRGSVVAE